MSAEGSPSSPADAGADLEEALVLIENLLRDAYHLGGGIVAAPHHHTGAAAMRFLCKHQRARLMDHRLYRGRVVAAEIGVPRPKASS